MLRGDNTDGPGLVDSCASTTASTSTVCAARSWVPVGPDEPSPDRWRRPARPRSSSSTDPMKPRERAVALAAPIARIGDPDAVSAADLVVNATPLGMGVVVTTRGEPEPLPLDPERLSAGQVVVDLVYYPAVTPLLAEARGRGARRINGLGMLIHQAAHAFRLWTSEEPPVEAMSAAAVATLGHRSPPYLTSGPT